MRSGVYYLGAVEAYCEEGAMSSTGKEGGEKFQARLDSVEYLVIRLVTGSVLALTIEARAPHYGNIIYNCSNAILTNLPHSRFEARSACGQTGALSKFGGPQLHL